MHPFAVMGAFETFPAIPTDMSEQVAFGMIKKFDQAHLDLFAKREGKKKLTAIQSKFYKVRLDVRLGRYTGTKPVEWVSSQRTTAFSSREPMLLDLKL